MGESARERERDENSPERTPLSFLLTPQLAKRSCQCQTYFICLPLFRKFDRSFAKIKPEATLAVLWYLSLLSGHSI